MRLMRRTGSSSRPAVAAVLAATLALTGCGLSGGGSSSASGDGGENATLRIGMASEAQSLDPPNFVLAGDFARVALIYEGLVKLGDNAEIEPALATDWEQLSETEWEFTLRQGVTFHDGTEFDSAAVKQSLERAAEQPQGAGFLNMIEEVRTPDDFTARVVLSRPFSGILNNLTVPVASIISPKALEGTNEELASQPVGTGPYQFVEWIPDTSMTFERYDGYWGEEAALAEVTFLPIPEASTRYSALRAGDVDVIENPPPTELSSMESSDEVYPIIEPKGRPVFLGFNLEEVTDVRVRRAVAHAIDQEAIVSSVLEGIGRPASDGLIPPEFIDNDPPIGIEHDPEEARRLLAEAGAEGTTIDLVLPTERYLKDEAVCEVIQRQLSKVGINVNLKVQETGTWYQSLLDRKTQMYWLGWGMSAGDPGDLLLRLFHSGQVNNMSQYSNKAVDDAIDSLARLAVGTEERSQVIQDIQRQIVEEDVAVVPIYHMSNFYAARSGVEGFHTTSSELLDLSQVTVD